MKALDNARFRLRGMRTLLAGALTSGPAFAHPGHESALLAQLTPDTVLAQVQPRNPATASQATIKVDEDFRVISANGLPDHTTGQFPNRNNPNRISAQNYSFRMPLKPRANTSPVPTGPAFFGVALNGVPFESGTAELWNHDWRYEAINGSINLGLDQNLAHVQPTGAYHYHGSPIGLIERLGGDKDRMLLIGWAADGYPIYTPQAYTKADDAKSELKPMRSSYQLKQGTRPANPNGPGGKYDGTFTADYEFIKGGGDLDECNGRTGVTPEFPDGTYYYCVTEAFPFFSRQWHGVADRSFMKGGPGGFGPPPGGRKGPPGGGGRGFPPPPPSERRPL